MIFRLAHLEGLRKSANNFVHEYGSSLSRRHFLLASAAIGVFATPYGAAAQSVEEEEPSDIELDPQLDAQAFPPQLNFPKPLKKELAWLKKKSNSTGKPNIYSKKHFIIQKALDQALAWQKAGKLTPATDFKYLSDAAQGDYYITPSKLSPLFDKPFGNHRNIPTPEGVKGYYDYADPLAFWVDFAAPHLGGGVFGKGFVQEEKMFCETPDLANAAAILGKDKKAQIQTRIATGNGDVHNPRAGRPTPIAMRATRVMAIDKGLYHFSSLDSVQTLKQLDGKTPLLKAPQPFLMLAASAPKLNSESEQKKRGTLQDLFNTFAAEFALAVKSYDGSNVFTINTGPIGCGDYKNDATVVLVLQILAAMHVSSRIRLRFWAYQPAEVQKVLQNEVTDILALYSKGGDWTVNGLVNAAYSYWK